MRRGWYVQEMERTGEGATLGSMFRRSSNASSQTQPNLTINSNSSAYAAINEGRPLRAHRENWMVQGREKFQRECPHPCLFS
jgi:hypothetical protein